MKLEDLRARLTHCSDNTAANIRQAVAALERQLGRPAEHTDLSDATIAKFRQWWTQQDSSRTERGARTYVSALRTLWRFAAEQGLMPGPPDGRKFGEPRGSEHELEFPPEGTLWEAFRVYASLRLCHESRDNWRLSGLTLRWFDRFLGRHATPADLTDANLVRFDKWLNTPTEDGKRRAERTTQALVERLLALWTFCANAAYVDRLPTVRRKNRWEVADDD